MFRYIRGTLAELYPDFAVIDCGGVGFRLTVSGTTFAALSPLYGSEAKLFSYMAVREDAAELYGFADEDELSAFKRLIAVPGVGPKAAMSVLSAFTPGALAAAVAASDAKSITRANGIGLKTAQKIIIELKDRLASELSVSPAEDGFSAAASGSGGDAVDALAVLGYSRTEAVEALRGINPSLPLEEIIGQALKKLAKI
ncbi:MAG: Holliday junction branch migration protein RuvA [Clostridiales bacterium]|nr:Holliday junction branch migration protein RuvA [Clostridiales bacterium]